MKEWFEDLSNLTFLDWCAARVPNPIASFLYDVRDWYSEWREK